MDQIKLNKWRSNFNKEVQRLQIEYDAFFQSHTLAESYQLEVEDDQNLSLKILNREKLPKEMIDRLLQIFIDTKPEDSI